LYVTLKQPLSRSFLLQVAVALGGQPATLSGLAGMGDLMLTCMGGQSRNKQVGVRLGRGETITAILEDRAKVCG
jgi:glycerol-3-phosphate dehydrogenase (NAD(P)+)